MFITEDQYSAIDRSRVRCIWSNCNVELGSLVDLSHHLTEMHVPPHNTLPALCQWGSCWTELANSLQLMWHLRYQHNIAPLQGIIHAAQQHSHPHQHHLHSQHHPLSPPHSQSPHSLPQQIPHPLSPQHHLSQHLPQHLPPHISQQLSQQLSQSLPQQLAASFIQLDISSYHGPPSNLSTSSASSTGSAHTAIPSSLDDAPASGDSGNGTTELWNGSPPDALSYIIKHEEPSHHHHTYQPSHHALTPGREQLLKHVQDHPCLWKGCKASFLQFEALTAHLSEDHIGMGRSEYVCGWTNCDRQGRGFGQRQKAMRHIQTHTGDKPFQCQVCRKRFSEANIMAQHMRTHTGEKPFKCMHSGCGRQFSISGALTIHRRVHTGEKPFKCKFEGCDKWFAESSNLTKHLRVHTGERPFQCPYVGCDKRFSRPDQVTRHKKTHLTDSERIAVMKAERAAEMRKMR